MSSLYWSAHQLPELRALPKAQRNAIILRARRSDYLGMFVWSVAFAALYMVVARLTPLGGLLADLVEGPATLRVLANVVLVLACLGLLNVVYLNTRLKHRIRDFV